MKKKILLFLILISAFIIAPSASGHMTSVPIPEGDGGGTSYAWCHDGYLCDGSAISGLTDPDASMDSYTSVTAQWGFELRSSSSMGVTYNTLNQFPNMEYDLGTGSPVKVIDIVNATSELIDWTVCKSGTCTDKSAINAGVYTVTATVKDDSKAIIFYRSEADFNPIYSTTQSWQFYIDPFDISAAAANTRVVKKDLVYNGSSQDLYDTFEVYVTINGAEHKLTNDEYTVIVKKDGVATGLQDAGTYTVEITGIGNYQGTVNAGEITVEALDFEVADIGNEYWTGSPITPSVIAYTTIGGSTTYLVEGKDYNVAFTNNINVGTATATVTGIGNYAGKVHTKTFEILPNAMIYTKIDGHANYKENNGTPVKQSGGASVSVDSSITGVSMKYGLSNGSYPYNSITEAVSASSGTNFAAVGQYQIYFELSKTGYETVRDSLTVNIKKGDSSLTITPKNISMKFNETKTFEISYTMNGAINVSQDNDIATVTLSDATCNASGCKRTATITPKQIGSSKFTVSLAGNDNYSGASDSGTLSIAGATFEVNVENSNIVYDGQPHAINITPSISGVTTTYSWDIGSNHHVQTTPPSFTEVGSYIVGFVSKANGYDDVVGVVTMNITSRTLQNAWITLDQTEYDFDGSSKTPAVTVVDPQLGTLTLNKDYIVTYHNNVAPSQSATVRVTGTGNYQGVIDKTFTIKAANIEYTVTDGLAEYTGTEIDGGAEVNVTFPSTYNLAFSKTQPTCVDGSTTCSAEGKSYNLTSMPRFKDVGTHTVWYRITGNGFETVEGTLNIVITTKTVKIPVSYPDEGLMFTGQSQKPSWIGYNSQLMSMSGDVSATNPGTYGVTFKLLEPQNVQWEDGTTTDKTVYWTIIKISVKEHETVTELSIDYDEWKQLTVDDGKITYDRPGYEQIGWTTDCTDNYDDASGLDIRACEFIDVYDTDSSVFGAFIAEMNGATITDTETPRDFYAVWSSNTYRITYDLCDAKGCGFMDGTGTSIAAYNTAFPVSDPYRPGYKFVGWEITEMDETPHEIGNVTTSEKTYTTPREWVGETIWFKNLTARKNWTVKFKALWEPITFRLNFNSNKGSYLDTDGNITKAELTGTVPSIIVTYDVDVQLPTNQYDMTGYDFVGWSSSPDWNNTSAVKYTDGDIVNNLEFIDWNKMAKEHWSSNDIDDALSNVQLYALWTRKVDTNFTVTIWLEKVGADGSTKSPVSYDKVAVETYTSQSDRKITINPYTYNTSLISSSVVGGIVTDTSGNNTSAVNGMKNTAIANDNHDPANTLNPTQSRKDVVYKSSTNPMTDNSFKGFAAPPAVDVIISPNGDTNVDLYYTRESYTITFHTNGGTPDIDRPMSRDYQVSVTFSDPSDRPGIKDGTNGSADGRGNSTHAEFNGWFNKELTQQITGVNGEYVQNLDAYAKWLQYSYTGKEGVQNSWTPWGLPNE